MAKKSVLGRGLANLIEDAEADAAAEVGRSTQMGGGISEIDLDKIEVNPHQPRNYFDENSLRELADSIRIHGIITPITVRRRSEDSYQLISGERRCRASKLAGLERIPAYVRDADNQQSLEMALIENIQREDLNPLEVALSYQRLLTECNIKQEELGDRVGKSRSSVTNYLRLLKLPPDIQIAVRDNLITFGHARALINLENVEDQLYVLKKIMGEGISVRRVEELVREIQTPKAPSSSKTAAASKTPNVEVKKVQEKLSNHFGTKVTLQVKENNQGEIKIPFYSIDDLNRLLEILSVI